MDVNVIGQLVGQYGFPIVMCAVMAWYVKYTGDQNREDIEKLNVQHDKEMTQVTAALNNNTLALQHLTDMLAKESER